MVQALHPLAHLCQLLPQLVSLLLQLLVREFSEEARFVKNIEQKRETVNSIIKTNYVPVWTRPGPEW